MSVINYNLRVPFRLSQWLREMASSADYKHGVYRGNHRRLADELLQLAIDKEYKNWQKTKEPKN